MKKTQLKQIIKEQIKYILLQNKRYDHISRNNYRLKMLKLPQNSKFKSTKQDVLAILSSQQNIKQSKYELDDIVMLILLYQIIDYPKDLYQKQWFKSYSPEFQRQLFLYMQNMFIYYFKKVQKTTSRGLNTTSMTDMTQIIKLVLSNIQVQLPITYQQIFEAVEDYD